MFRIRKFLSLMAVPVIGSALLGLPGLARADFELRYSTNGGASWTTITSPTPFINTTVSGLSISATGSASTSSSISTMDLSVNGNSSVALSLIVQLWGNPAITLPPPEVLSYVMNGSVLPSSSGSITEQIWTTNNSTPFDTTNLVTGTSGAKTPNTTGSFVFNGNPPGYSVEQQTTITLTAGGSISSDQNLQIVPTPAPAALILVLSGAPVFGGMAWMRRRKSEAA